MPTWAPSREALQARDGRRLGRLAALERDDGLAHVVVAGREVDGLLALGADRHLVDVEVEGLHAGREGLVEGDALPDDGALVVAELLCHGVGDRRLEALAVGGLVVLEPRLVRRLVRRDRQLAGGLGGQLALGAGGPGRTRGLVGGLLLRLRGTADGGGEQGYGRGGYRAAQYARGKVHGGRVTVRRPDCPGHSPDCPHSGNTCCALVNGTCAARIRRRPPGRQPGPPVRAGIDGPAAHPRRSGRRSGRGSMDRRPIRAGAVILSGAVSS